MSDAPKNTWDPNFIDDISERVYRYKLEKDNYPAGAVKRMLADDAKIEGPKKEEFPGQKLRNRATSFYGQVTRGYLAAFGLEPQKPLDRFELGDAGEIIARLTEAHRGTRGKPL